MAACIQLIHSSFASANCRPISLQVFSDHDGACMQVQLDDEAVQLGNEESASKRDELFRQLADPATDWELRATLTDTFSILCLVCRSEDLPLLLRRFEVKECAELACNSLLMLHVMYLMSRCNKMVIWYLCQLRMLAVGTWSGSLIVLHNPR